VATWFTRSGTVPLDISMAFSASCGTECDISTLLSVLVAASRRWKQIQIVVSNLEDSPLDNLSADDVPLLQTMQFGGRIGYFTEPTTPMKPLLSFLATQSLRSLTFSGASNSVYRLRYHGEISQT
jgi:hypothetical protein